VHSVSTGFVLISGSGLKIVRSKKLRCFLLSAYLFVRLSPRIPREKVISCCGSECRLEVDVYHSTRCACVCLTGTINYSGVQSACLNKLSSHPILSPPLLCPKRIARGEMKCEPINKDIISMSRHVSSCFLPSQ
jgi:hypothetical protein